MHKNQILSCVTCCIRLKCSALGELKDDQEAKHGLTWCWSHSSVSQGVQHCDRKTKSGGNWRWLGMEAPAGAPTGLSECLGHTAVNNTPAHFPPTLQHAQTLRQRLTWQFTELRQNGDTDHCQTQSNTKMHTGNLDTLKESWKTHKKSLNRWCYGPWISQFNRVIAMPGCQADVGHHQHAAAHGHETESMNQWKHFFFQFEF